MGAKLWCIPTDSQGGRGRVSVNWVGIASDNGLSPIQYQAIIWTNAGLLSIGPLGTNFSKILIKIQNFSFTKMHLKLSSAKQWPFCPGGEELEILIIHHFTNAAISLQTHPRVTSLVVCQQGWALGPDSIKMSSYQYRKSHCGDKMVIRLSYLNNAISYTRIGNLIVEIRWS